MKYEEAKKSVCKTLSEYVTVLDSEEYYGYEVDFDNKKAKSDLTKMYGENIAVILIELYSDENLTWEYANERNSEEYRLED